LNVAGIGVYVIIGDTSQFVLTMLNNGSVTDRLRQFWRKWDQSESAPEAD